MTKPSESAKAKAPAKKTSRRKAGSAVGARSKGKPAMTVKAKRAKSPAKGKSPDSIKIPEPGRGPGRPAGTPDVWTEERKAEVVKLLEDYTWTTDYPSVADFCFKFRIRKQRLYEFEEFAEPMAWLLAKKESRLEEMGRTLTQYHGSRATFIIFALKQLGWKDKSEVEHSGSIGAGVLRVKETMAPEDWAAAAAAQQGALLTSPGAKP